MQLYGLASVLLVVSSCNTLDHRNNNLDVSAIEEVTFVENALLKTDDDLIAPKPSICLFDNPDTEVNGMLLRDTESTERFLGTTNILNADSIHYFYSATARERLALKVHPGDFYSQVAVFSVSYTSNLTDDKKIKKLNTPTFTTTKGIALGLNKKQLIDKLGKCYLVKDSTPTSITLHYRMDYPNDNKEQLLKKNNVQSYYATYKIVKDKLSHFEFGFEYP